MFNDKKKIGWLNCGYIHSNIMQLFKKQALMGERIKHGGVKGETEAFS